MGQYFDNKLEQSLGSQGVYPDVVSRPPHILLDVNGKEHSDPGITRSQIPYKEVSVSVSLESLWPYQKVTSLFYFLSCLSFQY